MKRALIFFFVLAIILTPIAFVEAGILDRIVPACNEGDLVNGSFGDRSCNICHIVQLIQNILSFIITISVMIATLMFVYAGFLYITASGSPDKLKKAHGIFWNVLIGFIFVLGAFLIVDTIMKTFYKENTKFGPWNEIECSSSPSLNKAPAPVSKGSSVISTGESNTNKANTLREGESTYGIDIKGVYEQRQDGTKTYDDGTVVNPKKVD